MNASSTPLEVDPGFVKALLAEDELGMVVRSHIYVELRVNEYLEDCAVRPEHLKGLKLRFSQKVQLACVMGFDPDYKPPLLALGDIRNGFAHRPDATLTAEMVASLYRSLPAQGKEMVQRSFSRTREQLKADGRFTLEELPHKDRFILITLSLERALFAARLMLAGSSHAA